MRHCENSALNPETETDNWPSFCLVSSDLSNKHCSHFIGSGACNNSSLQASPHQKVGLQGIMINRWCLGSSCNVINCHVFFNTNRQYGRERPYHLYLWLSHCCLCLFVIRVSYSSIVVKFLCGAYPHAAPWCSQQTKKTDRNIIHNDYRRYM